MNEDQIKVIQIIKHIFPKIFGTYIEDNIWFYFVEKGIFNVVHKKDLDNDLKEIFHILKKSPYIQEIKKEKDFFKIYIKSFSNNYFKRNFEDSSFLIHLYYYPDKIFQEMMKKYSNYFKDNTFNFLQTEVNKEIITNDIKIFDFSEYEKYMKKKEGSLEFELKINLRDNKNLFFKALYNTFKKYNKFYSFEKSTVKIYPEDIREIIINNSEKYFEKKTSIHYQKYTDNIKSTLNKEERIDYKVKNEEIIIRNRNRHSFISFNPILKNIRLDFTEIISTKENKFEIEIDWTSDSSSHSSSVIQQHFDYINFIFNDIFCSMNDSLFYYDDEIIKYFNNLSKKLILTDPVNLIIDTLVLTKGKLLEKEFLIAPKADGYTRFLTIFKGDVYMFFHNNLIERYTFNKNYKILQEQYILIGEKIPANKRNDDISVYPYLFTAFDLIDLTSPEKQIYEKRYIKLKNILKKDIIVNNKLKIILKKATTFSFDNFTSEEKIDNKEDFKTDGFILTSKTNEKEIFKIKPFEELSIDFEVDLKNKTLYCSDNNIFKALYYNEDTSVDWNNLSEIINREFKWINNLSFKPIIEFNPNKDFILNFNRFRNFDKKYPNSKKTALSVWNEITRDKSIFEYFQKDIGIPRLRKFNNVLKTFLLKNISNEFLKEYEQKKVTKLNILDIGSGKGGDLQKYENIDFENLVLVEPNKENLTELNSRLKNFISYNKKNVKVLNTGGEDKIPILKEFNFFEKNDYNVITSMLSLTFLFNPDLYPSFVDLINKIKQKKAFYFFTFEKNKVLNVLKKYGKESKDKIIINKPNKYIISYDKKTQKVYIDIENSIVADQTEYLVEIEKLAKDTNAKELFIYSTDNFCKKYYPNIFLTEDEEILNECYIFGKILYGEKEEEIKEKLKVTKSISFDQNYDTVVPKTFIDYFLIVEDFYKPKYRAIKLKKNSIKSEINKKWIVSEKYLKQIKETFPFRIPFYKFSSYFSKTYLENKYEQELIKEDTFVVLNKAYIKMSEIINNFREDLITKDMKVFCNAELPGGFLTCIYNNFKCMYPKNDLDWYASSLVEGNTYLIDTYNLIEKYPNRWLMNSKFNGDITKYDNLKYIEKYFNSSINLYTSDVGVGMDEDIIDQEESNFFVNIGQIKCGLETLSNKGCMILKTYTFFKDHSKALLNLIYNVFDEVFCVKPGTSSCLNSEIYIIALRYNRKEYEKVYKKSFDEYVKISLTSKNIFTFKQDFSKINFDEVLYFFFNYQINALKLFRDMLFSYSKKFHLNINEFEKFFSLRSIEFTKQWIKKNPIKFSFDCVEEVDIKILENYKEENEREYKVYNKNDLLMEFNGNFDNKFFPKEQFYTNKKVIYIYNFNYLKKEYKKYFNNILLQLTFLFENESKNFYSIVLKIDKNLIKTTIENEIKETFFNVLSTLNFKNIFEDDEKILYEFKL